MPRGRDGNLTLRASRRSAPHPYGCSCRMQASAMNVVRRIAGRCSPVAGLYHRNSHYSLHSSPSIFAIPKHRIQSNLSLSHGASTSNLHPKSKSRRICFGNSRPRISHAPSANPPREHAGLRKPASSPGYFPIGTRASSYGVVSLR